MTSLNQSQADTHEAARMPSSWRGLTWATLAASAAIILLCATMACAFARFAVHCITYPAGLNIGEGVVLQQALRIPSAGMYGPVDAYPFTVFEYPPVYYLTVRALAAFGIDLLTAGRCVSVGATLLLCIMLGLLARCVTAGRMAGWVGACVAGTLPLTLLPLIAFAPLMRVDMVGLAATLAGLLLMAVAEGRFRPMAFAMLAFTVAIFTKQNLIAAPLAGVTAALMLQPRQVFRAVCVGAAVSLAALGILELATSGGFLRHVVQYQNHRYSFASALHQTLGWMGRFRFFWILVACGVAIEWRHALRDRAAAAKFTTLALYLLITTSMMLLIGKTGSWVNYLIEWMCAGCLFIGCLTARVLAGGKLVRVFPLLAAQCWLFWNGHNSLRLYAADLLAPAHAQQNAALVARMHDLPGLIAADDLVALHQSGHAPSVESFIFVELVLGGILPEDALDKMIRAHRFAAIETNDDPDGVSFATRWLPGTQAAISAAYPREEVYGREALHLP